MARIRMHASVFLETLDALRRLAPVCAVCLGKGFGISFSATHLRLTRLDDTGYVEGARGQCKHCRDERRVFRLTSRGETLARALPRME